MESRDGGGGGRPTAEEVISKLKDDGDFDALRLKIIRKLKENEDLRNQIISEVKQSAAFNREGAENMKPRQLSDAIHQEIGNKIMGQLSDEIWKIIRSSDGMNDEIRESVKSVCDKLMSPPKEETNTLSAPGSESLNAKEDVSQAAALSCEVARPSEDEPVEPPGFVPSIQVSQAGILSENEPLEPPGFSPMHVDNHSSKHTEPPAGKQPLDHHIEQHRVSPCSSPTNDKAPPGFAQFQNVSPIAGTADDEDPDVPPGFG